MARKKKKATLSLGKLLTAVLLAVAVILWFALPALKHSNENIKTTYSFLNLTFGRDADSSGVLKFEFSVLNLIPLVLLALGLALSVLDLVMKKPLFANINLVVIALAVLGGGLLFLTKTFANPSQLSRYLLEEYILALGVYASAIPAIAAGVVRIVLK